MIARRLISSLIGLLSATAVFGQALNYAQRTTTIRAGTLIIESQRTAPVGGIPLNPESHVWFNLDQDNSAKPPTWSFVNPRAQTVLTQSLHDRWVTLVGGAIPTVGSRLDKKSGAYWEVSLTNATDAQLAEYDVLMLSLQDGMLLNSLERERLRRFVDQGGVLICDLLPSGSLLVDVANCLPIPFALGVSGGAPFVNPLHPLLSYPHSISDSDLLSMQFGGNQVIRPVDIPADITAAVAPILGTVRPDSLHLDAVYGDANGANIAAAELGDGHVVITTRGISATLNRGLDRSTNPPTVVANNGFLGLDPVKDFAFTAAAKLIVNAISLGSGYPSKSAGSRKTHSTNVDIAAPLLRRFGEQLPGGSSFIAERSPAVFAGRIVAVSNGRVTVMDTNPANDLDGDGNPDDGIIDPPGYSADVIWQSAALAGGVGSAPTCVNVPDSSFTNPLRGNLPVTNMVLVTDGNGNVNIFDLESPGMVGGVPVPIAPIAVVNAPSNVALPSATDAPFAVTVHEGIGFVTDVSNVDQLGRVWMFTLNDGNVINSSGPWIINGSPRLGEPSGSPTVAYIPILDNSGGVDLVAYVPTANNTSATPGADHPAGFTSLWVGVRGEKPLQVQKVGNTLRVQTRAALQGLPVYYSGGVSSLGIRIQAIDNSGNPWDKGTISAYFDGTISAGGSNGEIVFGLTGANPGAIWDGPGTNVSLRIDYMIDWGATSGGPFATPGDAYVRGNLEFPDDPNLERKVIGNLAVAPNGTVFAVTGKAPRGGTLFAVHEDGRGDFKMLYRWDLFDRLNLRVNGSGGTVDQIEYEPTIIDEDGLTQLIPFLNGRLSNLTFKGGPTVKGNTVYVVAQGFKNAFIPTSILMAFNADPKPAEIEVNNLSPGFAIVQPDVARSNDVPAGAPPTITPSTFSALQPGQFTYEQDGSSTLGKVRLDSMMAVRRGRIRDSLSTSLPIYIRRGGQPDVVIEPELTSGAGPFVGGNARGRWSPLKWYTVFTGYTVNGEPLVTGPTLYLGGSSVLPSLLSGAGFAPRGLLYGMDATIAPNDPFIQSNSVRPWMLQLNQLLPDPSGPPPGFKTTPSVRWPQANGVRSFADYRIRLLQAALEEPSALGVVGGDGTLVTWGANNVYGFARSDFLITDEGRVGRFDPSGNPIWTSDSTQMAGDKVGVSSASNSVPLSKPTRIYASGESTYWVVDTGNDRIVRIDNGARELRTISDFKVDPGYRPAGMLDNEPTHLRQPRDVLVYTTYEPKRPNPANPFTDPSDIGTWGPNDVELWVHYVIADAGNYRLLELVDRYHYNPQTNRVLGAVSYVDPNSTKPGQLEKALGMALWHSPSELSGKNYAYNSISRIFVPNGPNSTRPVIAFGFGNFEPGRATFGLDTTGQSIDVASGYGGIVIFDGANTRIITKVAVPAIGNAGASIFPIWSDVTNSFSIAKPAVPEQKLAGLSSVNLRYVQGPSGPTLAVMYTDNNGAYEVIDADGNPATDDWTVRWCMPNDVFRAMRRTGPAPGVPTAINPENFRAAFARRLPSGEVLLVNSYYGRTRGGAPYQGEVVIVEGEPDPFTGRGFDWNAPNLGFDSLSVKFELPPIQGARGLVLPLFADRR